MSDDWKQFTEVRAGGVAGPATPNWVDDLPLCDDTCRHHDGKRCGLIGARAPHVCEPVVVEMARLLRRARTFRWPREEQS